MIITLGSTIEQQIEHRLRNNLCVVCGKNKENEWSGIKTYKKFFYKDFELLMAICDKIDFYRYNIGTCHPCHYKYDFIPKVAEEMLKGRKPYKCYS